MGGRRIALLMVSVTVAVAAVLVVVFWRTGSPAGSSSPAAPAPAGWRWESYGGVQVQVPGDWGYGTSGTPACLERAKRQPYVGRPGMLPLVGCSGPPVPALDKRTSYLWFGPPTGASRQTYDGGWVSQTRTVGGVSLTVLTDDPAVLAHILDSAQPVTGADGNGCPATHPVTAGHDARPDPGPGGLATTGAVESITLCRYSTGERQGVLSTGQLPGEPAAAVARAILAAPQGSGPNSPESCLPSVAYGDEVLLLKVNGSTRTQEVFVRYSGCDGHGFDDGRTVRQLTAEALRPLLTGPHQPSTLSGPVGTLVWP